ncbi:MAG: HAMP domain-containing sensor histidine kinase [Bacteroidales bacterium]|nr:HAMP domain-containing sensor histidine kinase [Bacteroidales bacterium]
MKIPFKVIAALIIFSLTGVFAYQAYWLTGLYGSMKKDMENSLIEVMQISDYNEMMLRCDSLRHTNMPQADTPSLLYVNEPFSTTIDKNGSVELLTKYFQRGMHSHLDLFTDVNLHTYDSLFVRMMVMRGIVHLPHRMEVVNLREDTTVVGSLNHPANYLPEQNAIPYYYNYDLHNKMAYRLWVAPLQSIVLQQMSGILCTSVLIIIILGIAFWFLIHIILRQKTVEEMKEDFTHNITHELKTPLAVAYTANDALLNFQGAEKPEKRRNYLQIVQAQLKQLNGLVEQILSMSMEQRKNFRLHYEIIELRPMLESLIAQHRLKADKPATFHLDVENDCTARADRTHLYNMVSNLIDNAIKYSDGQADVCITVRREERDLALAVKDKGIGIPADKQRHLFEKFYRVPTGNRHDVKGYGLGLYYVKTMIEQHRGNVEVKSIAGKGSTFTLRIPL